MDEKVAAAGEGLAEAVWASSGEGVGCAEEEGDESALSVNVAEAVRLTRIEAELL